ncbi:MAG: bifunctional diaminohydroxyphosphoribosylaminopyrimidine deaminase/5-amino-6-(5-phosphoribosylamino)uracil reductase RibD [Candidatus Metalachnospira sp.]|nr:bifunctional diaminohydroxyphosphoribosylaminopyrimidine deaminase/5-amino-6-(5-phosphoribosylamino)uracil reductase RibD [Candidatus Metalachnospira sp.]
MTNEDYMRLAIQEARKGMGFTSPNPMVGAVIVKDGKILNKDYHRKYGEFHAERNAILNCTENMNGADIYVTLEPCCHYGKTPPCTDIIIASGIKRAFIGSADPNPLVAGKGAKKLRDNGIEVLENVLRDECDELNDVFFHYITDGTPFVAMKYAMTADGKIATRTGDSQWITGEEARKNVHISRLRYSAIMVGVGTVLKDNPLLTCRIEGGRNPIRIICDSHLRTPLTSEIIKSAGKVPTIIATVSTDERLISEYEKKGCFVVKTTEKNGRVDLNILMKTLGKMKIDSILLEGGGELNFSALREGIVNKVECYIAPKIFGGAEAKSPVGGFGVSIPDEAFKLQKPKLSFFGDDILIEWRVK